MTYTRLRLVGFMALMALSVVSRILVEAKAAPISTEAWWVTTACTTAAWAALMGAACRRRPTVRSDSALVWVGAVGFAVQASAAGPGVILVPIVGLVLAIAFATFLLVRAPEHRGQRSRE